VISGKTGRSKAERSNNGGRGTGNGLATNATRGGADSNFDHFVVKPSAIGQPTWPTQPSIRQRSVNE